jgi:hypothetical protein
MFCFGEPSLKCAILACEIQLSRTAAKERAKNPYCQDSCNAMTGRRCSALSTSTPKAGHQGRRAGRRLSPSPAGLLFEDKNLFFHAIICGVPQLRHAASLSPRRRNGSRELRMILRVYVVISSLQSWSHYRILQSLGRQTKTRTTECRHGLRRRRRSFDLQSLSSWLSVGG